MDKLDFSIKLLGSYCKYLVQLLSQLTAISTPSFGLYIVLYRASSCGLDVPQRVEYFSVVPYPKQLIGRRDPVRVGSLGISKDGVGQPDQADHIAARIRDKERGTCRK